MAKRKPEETPKGSPPWMNTFSDLMNLLLCFFVLLFSMSSVDTGKFELIAASFSNSFSVLPDGGSTMGEGSLITSGISQLSNIAVYTSDLGVAEETDAESEAVDEVEREKLAQSEKMAEAVDQYIENNNMQESVEVDFTAQYVLLTLNGALLFDSGKADIRADAVDLINKIGDMLKVYEENIIEVEGHTDNVPINNHHKFKNNNELSSFRALAVAGYFIEKKSINPAKLKYSGRGEYVPVADNTTADGRARNRRVEIKIYNKLSSY